MLILMIKERGCWLPLRSVWACVVCAWDGCQHVAGEWTWRPHKVEWSYIWLSSGTLFQGMNAFFDEVQFFVCRFFSATTEGSGNIYIYICYIHYIINSNLRVWEEFRCQVSVSSAAKLHRYEGEATSKYSRENVCFGCLRSSMDCTVHSLPQRSKRLSNGALLGFTQLTTVGRSCASHLRWVLRGAVLQRCTVSISTLR